MWLKRDFDYYSLYLKIMLFVFCDFFCMDFQKKLDCVTDLYSVLIISSQPDDMDTWRAIFIVCYISFQQKQQNWFEVVPIKQFTTNAITSCIPSMLLFSSKKTLMVFSDSGAKVCKKRIWSILKMDCFHFETLNIGAQAVSLLQYVEGKWMSQWWHIHRHGQRDTVLLICYPDLLLTTAI